MAVMWLFAVCWAIVRRWLWACLAGGLRCCDGWLWAGLTQRLQARLRSSWWLWAWLWWWLRDPVVGAMAIETAQTCSFAICNWGFGLENVRALPDYCLNCVVEKGVWRPSRWVLYDEWASQANLFGIWPWLCTHTLSVLSYVLSRISSCMVIPYGE